MNYVCKKYENANIYIFTIVSLCWIRIWFQNLYKMMCHGWHVNVARKTNCGIGLYVWWSVSVRVKIDDDDDDNNIVDLINQYYIYFFIDPTETSPSWGSSVCTKWPKHIIPNHDIIIKFAVYRYIKIMAKKVNL